MSVAGVSATTGVDIFASPHDFGGCESSHLKSVPVLQAACLSGIYSAVLAPADMTSVSD